MKTFKILLLSLLFITATSCGDDDDGGAENTSGDLVGTWQMTSFEYSGNSTTEFQGVTLDSEFSGFAKDIDYSITFSEDPNEYDANGGYTIELTTTVGGQSTTQDQPVMGDASGTWELNDMILTITTAGESQDATITVLNANTLTFTLEETETTMVNGATQVSTIMATSTFTR